MSYYYADDLPFAAKLFTVLTVLGSIFSTPIILFCCIPNIRSIKKVCNCDCVYQTVGSWVYLILAKLPRSAYRSYRSIKSQYSTSSYYFYHRWVLYSEYYICIQNCEHTQCQIEILLYSVILGMRLILMCDLSSSKHSTFTYMCHCKSCQPNGKCTLDKSSVWFSYTSAIAS